MTSPGISAVQLKLRETAILLERLRTTERAAEWYTIANAFVSSARSVLYIAQFQLGYDDPQSHGGGPFTTVEAAERKRFDAWFKASPEIKAVLGHPLATDRKTVVHRSGQAGFVHVPKPYPGWGMAISHGNAFRQAAWMARPGHGRLPLKDANFFYYLDTKGICHDAMPFCEAYCELVKDAVFVMEKRPWL